MANPFDIPFLPKVGAHTQMEELSERLDQLEPNGIIFAPWATGAELPAVSFTIAHNSDAILLKYYVTEPEIKATYHNFNDPVYEDSCVEWFISFGNEADYYNLEFNCAGTARMAFGADRNERTFISARRLEAIRYMASIGNDSAAGINWTLTLYLPKQLFKFHPNLQLEQTPVRVNFYKCGDGLSQPHFLCWSNIIADKPNFHLPAFFKEATFNKATLLEK
jgi:hypothetical protein